MKRLYLLSLLIIVGCASSSGVVPIGKDLYMVSGRGKSPGRVLGRRSQGCSDPRGEPILQR